MPLRLGSDPMVKYAWRDMFAGILSVIHGAILSIQLLDSWIAVVTHNHALKRETGILWSTV